MKNNKIAITKKDYWLCLLAGLAVGLLLLPILRSAKPIIYENYAIHIVVFFLVATPIGLTISYYLGRIWPVFWQLGKFILSGGLSFCVDLGVLSFLSFAFYQYLGIGSEKIVFSGIAFLTFYSLYKSASFIVANINSYYWNKYWTFHEEGKKEAEFIQFFIVSLVGFFVNVAVASLVFKLFPPILGLTSLSLSQWELMGAVAGAIAGLVWNFLGYKFVVFKK